MAWYVDIIVYIWSLFKLWISTLFVTPFQTTDMLWILVPVWLTWFFAEFFQEKMGTSMGNAITNSLVVLWASIDCTRQTILLMTAGIVTGFWNIFGRFALVFAVLVYGGIIVYFGIKGNKIIKYIGRVREVTYVFAMFVPIFYNVIPFSFNHLLAAILFFPLFYYSIELLDKYTPNPKAVVEDLQEKGSESSVGERF